MNVEGDFRYVDSGGFDECADFVEHLEICHHNWEEAFLGWSSVSKKWKEDCKVPNNHWGPWNLVKVIYWFTIPLKCINSLEFKIYLRCQKYSDNLVEVCRF